MDSACRILENISQCLDLRISALTNLYRDLHAHPELSGREERTSGILAQKMESAGFSVTRNVGGHGVVGIMTRGEGPVVMIRADMDALPLVEETGLPFASTVRARDGSGQEVGVMHACGHDLHTAVLAGTAEILADCPVPWTGTLVLVGQPAEETGTGAAAMLSDGLYSRFPRPDYALALHAGPDLAPGYIGYREGIFSAGTDSLDICVRGLGGHAAHPDRAKDPVVLAAEIVLAFQVIISREVPPGEFGLITVGSIHGGSKHNAIPDQVMLQVNIRYFREEIRNLLLASIRRVAEYTARSAGIPEERLPLVTLLEESVPPLECDPLLAERVATALSVCMGRELIRRIDPLSGSEDFGFYGRVSPPVPLFYFRVGTGMTDEAYLHSSRFTLPPEDTVRLGVTAMSIAALELLIP